MSWDRTEVTPRLFSSEHNADELQRLSESAWEAIQTTPRVLRKWVTFTAAGVAGTELPPIGWPYSRLPDVAVIERVRAKLSPASDLGGLTLRSNFSVKADGIVLYEPDGLTANTAYEAVVMFSEVG